MEFLRSFYIFLRFSIRPRTICGAGAFACQLVMFYRRRLPHWHPDLTDPTFLFVTWRLAGSLPRARLPQPHNGAPLSAGRAFLREMWKLRGGLAPRMHIATRRASLDWSAPQTCLKRKDNAE